MCGDVGSDVSSDLYGNFRAELCTWWCSSTIVTSPRSFMVGVTFVSTTVESIITKTSAIL